MGPETDRKRRTGPPEKASVGGHADLKRRLREGDDGQKGAAREGAAAPTTALDWRDPQQYTLIGSTDFQQIWEFLRRSPRYRAAWADGRSPLEFHLQYLLDPNSRCSDEELQSVFRRPGLELAQWSLSRELAFNEREYRQLDAALFGEHVRSLQSDPTRAVMVFNLTMPLKPQLAAARSLLSKKQGALIAQQSASPERPPHHRPRPPLEDEEFEPGPAEIETRLRTPGKLGSALRALDGRDQGATFEEIGSVLYPQIEPESATARARRLVETGQSLWEKLFVKAMT